MAREFKRGDGPGYAPLDWRVDETKTEWYSSVKFGGFYIKKWVLNV